MNNGAETTDAFARGQRDMKHRAAMAVIRSAGPKLRTAEINLLAKAAEAVMALNETPDPPGAATEEMANAR